MAVTEALARAGHLRKASAPQTLSVPEDAPETIVFPSGENTTLRIPKCPALLSVWDATRPSVAASAKSTHREEKQHFGLKPPISPHTLLVYHSPLNLSYASPHFNPNENTSVCCTTNGHKLHQCLFNSYSPLKQPHNFFLVSRFQTLIVWSQEPETIKVPSWLKPTDATR